MLHSRVQRDEPETTAREGKPLRCSSGTRDFSQKKMTTVVRRRPPTATVPRPDSRLMIMSQNSMGISEREKELTEKVDVIIDLAITVHYGCIVYLSGFACKVVWHKCLRNVMRIVVALVSTYVHGPFLER